MIKRKRDVMEIRRSVEKSPRPEKHHAFADLADQSLTPTLSTYRHPYRLQIYRPTHPHQIASTGLPASSGIDVIAARKSVQCALKGSSLSSPWEYPCPVSNLSRPPICWIFCPLRDRDDIALFEP